MLPDEELEFLRQTPVWSQMVALAPQSVAEWVAMTAEDPTVEHYRELTVPTLLLGGDLTTEHPSFATHTLADAWVVEIDGQGHSAHHAAPDEVARAVAGFLADVAE